MERYYVTADRLTALLALNRCYEAKPLPFRMQPNVEFIVTEAEYVSYCETLSHETFLSAPVHDILESISKYRTTGRNQDYCEQARYFARDLSVGQMKELMYAFDACKGATIITAQFSHTEGSLKIAETSDNWITSLSDKIQILDDLFMSRGYNTSVASMISKSYSCSKEVRAHNMSLLKRSVYLINFADLKMPFDLIL